MFFADRNGNGTIEVSTTGGYSEVLQQEHYYPFGMTQKGEWKFVQPQIGGINQYQYNSKELNDDFGLNWNDYGARWYDASIGRWGGVDPLAEKYSHLSPYNYVANNPMISIDPDGKRIKILYSEVKKKKNGKEIVKHRSIVIKSQKDLERAIKKSGNNAFVKAVVSSIQYNSENLQGANYTGGAVYESLIEDKDVLTIAEGHNDSNSDASPHSYNPKNKTIVYSNKLAVAFFEKENSKHLGNIAPSVAFFEESVHAFRDIIEGKDVYNIIREALNDRRNLTLSKRRHEAQENEEEEVNKEMNSVYQLSGIKINRSSYKGTRGDHFESYGPTSNKSIIID